MIMLAFLLLISCGGRRGSFPQELPMEELSEDGLNPERMVSGYKSEEEFIAAHPELDEDALEFLLGILRSELEKEMVSDSARIGQ